MQGYSSKCMKTRSKSTTTRPELITTIDGPVAAGKTTAARSLAIKLGYTLLDTGAIYRSVALAAAAQGLAHHEEERIAELARSLDISFEFNRGDNRVFLQGKDVSAEIRVPEISRGASVVSALPLVRQALLDRQRQMAARGNVVAEGRDTGTIVFPDADAKFFLTAAQNVRAQRRQRELSESGDCRPFSEVLASLVERDHRDTTRSVAPLKPAADALVIDTTGMTIEAVVAEMLRHLPIPGD